VSFDDRGLFIGWSLFLGFSQLLDETHRSALEATLEPSAGTGVYELWYGEVIVQGLIVLYIRTYFYELDLFCEVSGSWRMVGR
jgi:hypothetical protein